eukprot:m.112038 g.112038  ORF g.112038 m.112038 type:complete len:333 (+) comp15967_c4_seq1:481-1479(+)
MDAFRCIPFSQLFSFGVFTTAAAASPAAASALSFCCWRRSCWRLRSSWRMWSMFCRFFSRSALSRASFWCASSLPWAEAAIAAAAADLACANFSRAPKAGASSPRGLKCSLSPAALSSFRRSLRRSKESWRSATVARWVRGSKGDSCCSALRLAALALSRSSPAAAGAAESPAAAAAAAVEVQDAEADVDPEVQAQILAALLAERNGQDAAEQEVVVVAHEDDDEDDEDVFEDAPATPAAQQQQEVLLINLESDDDADDGRAASAPTGAMPATAVVSAASLLDAWQGTANNGANTSASANAAPTPAPTPTPAAAAAAAVRCVEITTAGGGCC